MRSFLAFVVLASLAVPALADAPTTPPPPPTLTVTLPVQDWVGVVRSVQNSTALSARDANEIVGEINRQYAASQKPAPKK